MDANSKNPPEMNKPFTSVAKVGPDRWLWCVWENYDTVADKKDPQYGYTLSKDEAMRKILEVTGATRFYEPRKWVRRRDELPEILHYPYSSAALGWRHTLAERRRKPNPKAAPQAQATEYVYHHESSWSDAGVLHRWTCAHRILKRTRLKIFVVASCHEDSDRRHGYGAETMILDRARLESVEPWILKNDPDSQEKGYYVHTGRFRGVNCGAFFTLDPEPPAWAKESAGGNMPECFAALGLKPPATEEQVKEAFRCLAHKHHPDHGGDSGRFLELKKHYEQALRLTATMASVS